MKLANSIHRLRTSPAYLRPTLSIFAVIFVVAGCQRAGTERADGSAEMGDTTSESTETAGQMIADSTVAEGRFVGKGGQMTAGSYRIASENGDLRLVLGDDFRTDEGPDLHVVLSPAGVDDVESERAMADEATLIVSPLSGLAGTQQYDLPDQVDLTGYQSVLIHCIEFSHLYGAAPLSAQ